MSIVDLTKARAHAAWIDGDGDETAAEWIQTLADEVEALERLLAATRATEQVALGEAARLAVENRELRAGLRELYERIGAMLAEARLIAEHHPDPAASAAALRIMREDKS